MAKNIDNKKCIHCLTIPDEITFDHVIPKSWYSAVHSKSVYKPKAPSCLKCNQGLGKQEKIVSHLMWACMPEEHPLRSELSEKFFRACGITPNGELLPGLTDRERNIRKLYAKKLFLLAKSSNGFDEKNIFPGFGYHAGYPKNIQKIVQINSDLMSSILNVASKVVRGFEYTQGGCNRYIEEPYNLNVYFIKDQHSPAIELMKKQCPILFDGTNTVQRCASPAKPLEPVYIIRLWDQWEIYGVIISSKI